MAEEFLGSSTVSISNFHIWKLDRPIEKTFVNNSLGKSSQWWYKI